MIRTFRHKGLRDLWKDGKSGKVDPALRGRALRRLDALESAQQPSDMNVPGFNYHPLQGSPQRYTAHVNGPWCITFGWDAGDAIDVDLEQYH
jgi:proteic killer suppression protein